MEFRNEYSRPNGHSQSGSYNSLMTDFFGFEVTVEEDTQLKNTYGGDSYIQYVGNGKFVQKQSPISSYYSEKTGTYTQKMRRNARTASELEFEDRFIKATGMSNSTLDEWVWRETRFSGDADWIYRKGVKEPFYCKAISCIVMVAVLAVCAWFFIGAFCESMFTETSDTMAKTLNSLTIIGTLLGIIFSYGIGKIVTLFIPAPKSSSLSGCDKETQIEYGKKLFAQIDDTFPDNAEAARILKERAIELKRVHPETPLTHSTKEFRKKCIIEEHERSVNKAKPPQRYGIISAAVLLAIIGTFLLVLYQNASDLGVILNSVSGIVSSELSDLQSDPVRSVLVLGGLTSLCAIVIWVGTLKGVDKSTFKGKAFIGVCVVGAVLLLGSGATLYLWDATLVCLPVALLAFMLCHKRMVSE